jgi:hypothetical protein
MIVMMCDRKSTLRETRGTGIRSPRSAGDGHSALILARLDKPKQMFLSTLATDWLRPGWPAPAVSFHHAGC